MTVVSLESQRPREAAAERFDNNIVDINVGAQMRARREMLKLALATVAAESEVREQELAEMESGARRASALRLRMIADLLGVDISYFYQGLHERTETLPDV